MSQRYDSHTPDADFGGVRIVASERRCSRPEGDIVGCGVTLDHLSPSLRRFSIVDASSPGVVGHFQNDTEWAFAGVGKNQLRTQAVEYEVTAIEVGVIVENLRTLHLTAYFHLNPDEARNSFNCVTILPRVFRGTTISIEVPSHGKMPEFVRSFASHASKWRPSCALGVRPQN